MSGRVRWIGVIGMVATGAVALAGCSDPTDATQNATTSTSATRSTAPPTTRVPAAPQLPGLWVATSAGIVDESGQRYASPAEGSNEVLRSLVDDGAGGVFYLRCPEGAASDCAVEHAHEPNGEPVELGRAEELLAVGTWGERPVLAVTAIEPTSEATSKPGDEAGGETGGGDPATQAPAQAPPRAVGHLLDPETGELVGTFDWYDAQRGPIALDLAAGTIVACVGEGERCEIGSSSDPATLPNAIDGIEPDLTVSSMVLDAEGSVLAWIQLEPMDGSVVAVHRDLRTGQAVSDELRTSDEALAEDAVTDGVWSAVRVGETVYLKELLDGTGAGTRTVPPTTTEIALRGSGASSGLASRL